MRNVGEGCSDGVSENLAEGDGDDVAEEGDRRGEDEKSASVSHAKKAPKGDKHGNASTSHPSRRKLSNVERNDTRGKLTKRSRSKRDEVSVESDR